MPELLAALDAFVQERRRSGDLDGGIDGDVVWMRCSCSGGDEPSAGATCASSGC
jgi:hypothetical protein